MDQAQTLTALDHHMRSISCKTPECAQMRAEWIRWYDGLGWFEKSLRKDTLVNGRARAVAFLKANGTVGSNFGAERPTIRQGARGAIVKEWQQIIGVKDDGDFGPGTKAATIKWQASHGLQADGVVGPATWAKADASTGGGGITDADRERIMGLVGLTSQQTYDNTQAARDAEKKATVAKKYGEEIVSYDAAGKVVGHPTIRLGSRGAPVKEWQGLLGLKPDGSFGKETENKTKSFQAAHNLKPDGIVGPQTWMAAYVSRTVATNEPLPGVVVDTAKVLPPAPAPTTKQVLAKQAAAPLPMVAKKPIGEQVPKKAVPMVIKAAPKKAPTKEVVMSSEKTSGAPLPSVVQASMFSWNPLQWSMPQKVLVALGIIGTAGIGYSATHHEGKKKRVA